MGIILGLATALCWGTGDFLARSITTRIGSYRALLFVQLLGFAALSAYLLPSGELAHRAAHATHGAWAWAVACALLNLMGSLLLYRAFEIGVLAIVSPIAASYAAVTAALSVLSGEVLRRGQLTGMALALLGVALTAGLLVRAADGAPVTAVPGPHKDPARGVLLAACAACAYGMAFWVLGYHVTPALGGTIPVWMVRLVSMLALAALASPLRQRLRLPLTRGVWGSIAVVGVIDTAGFVAFAQGAQGDQIAMVGVLSSLFSAVTVLLARLFLHDRLARTQWLGLACIFAGVALVSA